MSIESIRELKHTEPFSPFNIVLRGGRVVWVSGPERIALSPTGKTVAVYEGETVSFLDLSRVETLETDARPPISPRRR